MKSFMLKLNIHYFDKSTNVILKSLLRPGHLTKFHYQKRQLFKNQYIGMSLDSF